MRIKELKKARRKKRLKKESRRLNLIKIKNYSKEIRVLERSISTNFAHPNCYAKKYNECDNEITSEHFLSKVLLEKFEFINPGDVEYIQITKPIKPINLTVNCLCKFHNNGLSEIDSYIELFFDEISLMLIKHNFNITFSGKNIEKWFGKCMLGYVSSGRITHNGKNFSVEDIDSSLLDFLYRDIPLPDEYGLYYINKIGGKIELNKSLKLQTLFLNKKIAGISVSFSGLKFYFILAKKDAAFSGNSEKAFAMHRPRLLERIDTNYKLYLKW